MLEKQLQTLETAGSLQKLVDMLLGGQQLWWKCCQEAVHQDPGWLFMPRTESIRSQISKSAVSDGGAYPDPVHAVVDSVYTVARALSIAPDKVQEQANPLTRIAQQWDQSGLLIRAVPSGAGRARRTGVTVRDGLVRQLESVLETLHPRVGDVVTANPAALAMVEITALLLVGAERRKRPVVRVSVVFGRPEQGNPKEDSKEQGSAGFLELQEFPTGPVGLFPDPQHMAGARSNGPAFEESLSYAWKSSPAGRCVLWRIILPDEPSSIPPIEGGSLGTAFALGLRELSHYPVSRRPTVAWLRGFFHGLRPKTAVTGVIDDTGHLQRVTDMGGKLDVAHRKRWVLIAPEANRADVGQAADQRLVKFAETIDQADRYARQWRKGRLTTAAALIAVAAISGGLIYYQQSAAASRQRTATQLAGVSGSLLDSNVGLAELFAVQAYRDESSPQTRAALFKAVSASPHLVRSIQANGTVSAIATAADGHALLAGTQGGNVLKWALTGDEVTGAEQQKVRLHGAVTAIAVNTDGSTGVAIDDTAVQIWPAGRRAASFRVPAGQRPTAVGVSPSGRFIAVATEVAQGASRPELMLFDRATGRASELALTDIGLYASSIALPSDKQVVVFNGGYGTWERISIPATKRIGGSRAGLFGVHDYAAALSADGRFFSYSNAGPGLPVWTASGTPVLAHPSLVARTRGTSPVGLALSADGSSAALAADSSIYVSKTTLRGTKAPAPVALTGAGQISRGNLIFLGNGGDRVVSASGDLLTLWDLHQYSRVGAQEPAVIPAACGACSEPRIALQPHGRYVAIMGGDGLAASLSTGTLGSPATFRQLTKPSPLDPSSATPPLWESNGSGIILVSSTDDSAQIWSPTSGRAVGAWPAPPDSLQLSDPASVLQLASAGHRVAEIDASGTVKIRDMATGKILHEVPGPADMAPTADGAAVLRQGRAALNSQAAYAAVIDSSSAGIRITDLTTGHARLIHEPDAVGVAFIRGNLLIQRATGALEIWDTSGSTLLNTIQGTPDTVIGPVIGDGNTIAETDTSGTVHLIDYPSGYLLGTLLLPSAESATSTGLAFSSDGQQLVTATAASGPGDNGEVTDWKIGAGNWIRIACDSAGHDISSADWKQYMQAAVPSKLACIQ